MNFGEARAEYKRLRQAYDERQISAEEYGRRVSVLQVRHPNGTYWAIDGITGGWLRYDGTSWVSDLLPLPETSGGIPGQNFGQPSQRGFGQQPQGGFGQPVSRSDLRRAIHQYSTNNGDRYVFISYASADRHRVVPVVNALRQSGIRCWIDYEDIAGGTNYGAVIAAAIEGAMALVLMSTPTSLKSRNVRQEIQLAWDCDCRFLPLLLQATEVPQELKYWLTGRQWIKVFDEAQQQWLPETISAIQKIEVEKYGNSGYQPRPF